MSGTRHLEIHETFLRKNEDGSQEWEAYARDPKTGRIGPTVESHSRKSVRSKARTAYNNRLTPLKVLKRVWIWIWRAYILFISFVLIPVAAISQDLGHGVDPHTAILAWSIILTGLAIFNIINTIKLIGEWKDGK